ncbi:NmrA family NAD(P)-binding protein [Mucilaginibacter celer]|uniref:NAD-dependent epimerase/dehydratase family protein n=1 Tax=Mucilaginibacter celer TaxID=2305508 RepID=A0A494VMW4_9SPHI|nr:NmrA family NAD(P)-binding protein [Mucilaginibacter celer]AYL94310.1 NAD-dependent epimerase/dehydratase family protein [Mucilaginibacter celer]
MEKKVLITGATGATGKNATANLLAQQIPVRALVHKQDERSDQLKNLGAEIVEGDLTDLDAMTQALQGITSAYFVYPIQVPGILDATAYFIQAAIEAKVGHIVNMSQRTSRRESPSHGAQNHWISERLFDYSGIPVTHLRPTLFAEWLQYFSAEIKHNNRLLTPFTEARYAMVAGEDTGRVISTVIAQPEGHLGQTYELYGPEELTQLEVSQILSEELGKTISYVPMDAGSFGEVLKANQFTPYFIQHAEGITKDFNEGFSNGMNDNIEKITGRKPLSIRDYIRQNINLFN